MNPAEKISILTDAFKKGDQSAFKAIYDLNFVKLSAYINSFTRNDLETEDILQETFIKLWNTRTRLDVKNSIQSYLFKTAYHTYIDKIRKDKRERKILDNWKHIRLLEAVEEDDDINKARIEKLKITIEKLPPRCKEVFMLCKYENLTHQQIADSLNISPKTVQAHMCKAYSFIRESIKNKGFFTLFLQLFRNLKTAD